MSNVYFFGVAVKLGVMIGHVDKIQAVTHDLKGEVRSNPLRFACYF